MRSPELDDDHAIAWTLSSGATLLVGERVAYLRHPGGAEETLVPKEDVADRARIRSYAETNNLPLDCGLVFRDLTDESTHQDDIRVTIGSATAVDVELSLADTVAPPSMADVWTIYPGICTHPSSRNKNFGWNPCSNGFAAR